MIIKIYNALYLIREHFLKIDCTILLQRSINSRLFYYFLLVRNPFPVIPFLIRVTWWPGRSDRIETRQSLHIINLQVASLHCFRECQRSAYCHCYAGSLPHTSLHTTIIKSFRCYQMIQYQSLRLSNVLCEQVIKIQINDSRVIYVKNCNKYSTAFFNSGCLDDSNVVYVSTECVRK